MGCGCGGKKKEAGDPVRARREAERRADHEAAREIIKAGTVTQK